MTGLEQNAKAKQAMQSLFISCPQALDEMTLTHKTDFYESKNVRAYLKTRKGVYFKELTGETKKRTLFGNAYAERDRGGKFPSLTKT